jgi:hypothetical protein
MTNLNNETEKLARECISARIWSNKQKIANARRHQSMSSSLTKRRRPLCLSKEQRRLKQLAEDIRNGIFRAVPIAFSAKPLLVTTQSVADGTMHSRGEHKWKIVMNEIQLLFADLDQRHYGGRLGAAGYRVQLTMLRTGEPGQCIWYQKIIQIDPGQVEPGEEFRTVLLHEMAHAACAEEGPSYPPHGRRWQREVIRLYLSGESCLGVEHAIISEISKGSLPLPTPAQARHAYERLQATRRRKTATNRPSRSGEPRSR